MRGRRRWPAAVIVAVCSLALPGCTQDASTPATSATVSVATTMPPATTGRSVGGSQTPVPPAGAMVVGDQDNGHTVTLRVGDQLEVRLASTYWRFSADTSTPALRENGQPSVTATPLNTAKCVPGEGCGTVVATFIAVSPGRAEVVATRTTCGEARGCVGNQGNYQLTVIIH